MAGTLSTVRRIPGASALLLVVALARLGVPALSLSMLLAVREASGTYAIAGATGAAYALAVAGSQLGWGRVADRRGAALVLRITAVAHGAALALFSVLVHAGSSAPSLIAAAALAGACFPPMATASRAAWRRVAAPDSQRALFALDGVTTEVTLILGPLAAGVLVAAAGGPVAVAVVGAVVGGSVLAGARSPLLPAAEPLDGPVRRAPPARLAALLSATVAMAGAIGAVTVAAVAFAERAALPPGLPLTVMAAGGVAGALLWGARAIGLARRTQLVGGLLLYAAVTAVAAAAPPPAVLGLLVLAGALMAPCDALQAQLCGELAPAARVTESFAWLNSANWIGFSAGTTLSGIVVDAAGPAGGFVACAAAAAVGAAILVARPAGA